MTKIGNQIKLEKKSLPLVKKGALMKIKAQKDKNNKKITHLVAFHNKLRIPINHNHKNFKDVAPNEFWYVEYHHDPSKNYAFGDPVAQPELLAEINIKDGRAGFRIIANLTKEVEVVPGVRRTKELFRHHFPASREWTEFLAAEIKQKCNKYNIMPYYELVAHAYKQLMEEVAMLESESLKDINKTVNHMKQMEEDPVAGPFNEYSVDDIKQYAAGIYDPYASTEDNPQKLMEPEEVASLLIQQLDIVRYDRKKRAFLSPKTGKLV